MAEACAPRVSLLQAYSTESARLRKWQALVGAKIPELRGEGFKISVTLKVTPEAPQPSVARQHNFPEAFYARACQRSAGLGYTYFGVEDVLA